MCLKEYVSGNRLIAVTFWYGTDSDDPETKIHIYDLSDIENIKEVGTFSQRGDYSSSRIIGNMTYLVLSQYINKPSDLPYTCKENGKSKNLLQTAYIP